MAVEPLQLEGSDRWPRRPRTFTHDLAGHPLLSLDRVSDWVGAISPKRIQQHQGDLPVLHPSGTVRTIKEPTSTVIDELNERNAWVLIQGLSAVSEVDELAQSVERAWLEASASLEGGFVRRAAQLLVASPKAAVPAHFDRQHILLHQVTGTKEVFIGGSTSGSGLDPEIESEVAVSMAHRSHNLYEMPQTATRYLLQPGTGLYIPPRNPHWVLGGTDTSVTLSCGWDTRWSDSEYLTYYWNERLRRVKVPAGPVVPGKWSNRCKAIAVDRFGRIVRFSKRESN